VCLWELHVHQPDLGLKGLEEGWSGQGVIQSLFSPARATSPAKPHISLSEAALHSDTKDQSH
jgi:hypothetical protein